MIVKTVNTPRMDAILNRLRENDQTRTTLNLELKGLLDVGGAAVARALETNTTLTTLDLGYNFLRDVSGGALASALEKNTTLTALNLGGTNYIGDEILERINRLLDGREAPEVGPRVKAAVVAPLRGVKRPLSGSLHLILL